MAGLTKGPPQIAPGVSEPRKQVTPALVHLPGAAALPPPRPQSPSPCWPPADRAGGPRGPSDHSQKPQRAPGPGRTQHPTPFHQPRSRQRRGRPPPLASVQSAYAPPGRGPPGPQHRPHQLLPTAAPTPSNAWGWLATAGTPPSQAGMTTEAEGPTGGCSPGAHRPPPASTRPSVHGPHAKSPISSTQRLHQAPVNTKPGGQAPMSLAAPEMRQEEGEPWEAKEPRARVANAIGAPPAPHL